MESADYERGFDDGFILRKEKDGKREWVGMTQIEIDKAWEWAQKSSPHGVTRIEVFTKSIEAKLREKNT